jgi:hypothetical protein
MHEHDLEIGHYTLSIRDREVGGSNSLVTNLKSNATNWRLKALAPLFLVLPRNPEMAELLPITPA